MYSCLRFDLRNKVHVQGKELLEAGYGSHGHTSPYSKGPLDKVREVQVL
jgi:hypothetical protein